jgi:lipopolysaccharide transport system ATP-binding protein
MAAAIDVREVSKSFRRYRPERPRTIQEVLARGFRGVRATDVFWALRDVTLAVSPGRTVGIIGTNGSGKSTLLRLVACIGKPDTGTIRVNGRIGALLDLGAGFHGDLSGRENAIISGVLNGLTRREVLRRLDAIVAFAEIEKFIDNPVRTYSTGMQMRLAFATAVHTEPEVLLIDEVLSVGDTAFQTKCLDRIAAFKAAGCSILLVSHESSTVQDLCDEAVWLSAGRIAAYGRSPDVVHQYLAHLNREGEPTAAATPTPVHGAAAALPKVRTDRGTEVVLDQGRFGSVELEITSVRLLDGESRPVEDTVSGRPLRIEIDYRATDKLVAPVFQVRILREDGLVCYDVDSERSELSASSIVGEGRVTLSVERLDLNTGRYLFDVGVYAHDWAYAYDHHPSVCSLVVVGDGAQDAVLAVPHCWTLAGDSGHEREQRTVLIDDVT